MIHEIHLRRFMFLAERTVGELLYDGRGFGYVVEDADRGMTRGMSAAQMEARKVRGTTCISAGRWPIVLEHSPRYGADCLTIQVLGHRLIRIHAGNDEDDTEGCICPGLGLVKREGVVVATDRSTQAVAWLRREIVPSLRAGGQAWIRIDRDPVAWSAAPFNPSRAIQ